jgi:two-component system response regulator YesN
MYSIAIIDDEALVRVGLKSLINWQDYDCQIVGEASNGEAGYELIKNSKPDIVITDIKMPVMDGLEMIEKVKAENIKTNFIVLSSYDEFNFVRQAMKLGVDDYIIKLELEPDILIKVLNKLKDKVQLDFKKKEKENKIEKHLRSNTYAMREEFFKKLIGKVITDRQEITEELDYLEIDLNSKDVVCALIKINEVGNLKKYEEEDINLLEFSVLNIVDEIIKDTFTGYTFNWTAQEYLVILSLEKDVDKALIKDKIRDMGHRVHMMLKQYFNIDVLIAISHIKEDFTKINEAYMECSQTIKQSFYFENERIIFFKDISIRAIESKFDFSDATDNLLKYIELNDLEAIEITFENIIDSFKKEKVSKEKAYDLCARIAYLIAIGLENDENSLKQIFGDNKTIFEAISKLTSLQEVIQWLKKIEKALCSFLLSKDDIQNNKIITMAKRFVCENAGGIISLQDVANRLNISAGYLSTIFKQETGISFIDYVTEVRINEAKILLKDSNYKIYEIAQMTGYENAYYFSKVFKKVTGITPSEFISKFN